METKLTAASRTQLERNTKESIAKLSSVLGIRATKFNGKFFEKLIQSSPKSLAETIPLGIDFVNMFNSALSGNFACRSNTSKVIEFKDNQLNKFAS